MFDVHFLVNQLSEINQEQGFFLRLDWLPFRPATGLTPEIFS